jgi:hypothetical protein
MGRKTTVVVIFSGAAERLLHAGRNTEVEHGVAFHGDNVTQVLTTPTPCRVRAKDILRPPLTPRVGLDRFQVKAKEVASRHARQGRYQTALGLLIHPRNARPEVRCDIFGSPQGVAGANSIVAAFRLGGGVGCG